MCNIAHFVAVQQLAFINYPALCRLEAKHGVDVGIAYHNQKAGERSVTSSQSHGDNNWLED